MSKICPNCGKEMPEESYFCLFCCQEINNTQMTTAETSCHSKKHTQKHKLKKLSFPIKVKKANLKLAAYALCVLVVTISAVLFVSDNVNAKTKTEVVTKKVAVTDIDGSLVTDANGENVYEVVEVTTEKQGFFENLFAPKTDETTTTSKALASVSTDKKNEEISKKTDETSTSEKAEAPGSSDSLQYKEVNGKIKITGYSGSASHVTVPAYIDGKPVAYIGSKAFADNSNITKITFESTTSGTDRVFYLPTESTVKVFSNLPNLTEIVLPFETSTSRATEDGTIKSSSNSLSYMFSNLPKLKKVSFASSSVNPDNNSGSYLFSQDGVIFQGKHLIYYPQGKADTSYTVPSFATDVEDAFNDVLSLNEIHFATSCTYFDADFKGCLNLQGIYADGRTLALNNKYFSQDGVLFYISNTVWENQKVIQLKCYPAGRKNASYTLPTLPDEYMYHISTEMKNNPYIKELHCPKSTFIWSHLATDAYKPASLKTIYLKSGDPYTTQVLNNGSLTSAFSIVTY